MRSMVEGAARSTGASGRPLHHLPAVPLPRACGTEEEERGR
jgi:hypothetical protein